MPKFKTRITVDEDGIIEANDEEEALSKLWDEIMNTGAWGSEVSEVEEDDS